MTKEELDMYKELQSAVETLVDYCNNSAILATTCEVLAVEAALERLYKARQEESEVRDMTNVINARKPAFPIVGQLQDVHEVGITMRDYFAAKAMEVNLYKCKYFPDEHWRMVIAHGSYEMADSMLKARNEK